MHIVAGRQHTNAPRVGATVQRIYLEQSGFGSSCVLTFFLILLEKLPFRDFSQQWCQNRDEPYLFILRIFITKWYSDNIRYFHAIIFVIILNGRFFRPGFAPFFLFASEEKSIKVKVWHELVDQRQTTPVLILQDLRARIGGAPIAAGPLGRGEDPRPRGPERFRKRLRAFLNTRGSLASAPFQRR